MKKPGKHVSCPVCKKKYSDTEAAQDHIQRKHPESHLAPKVKGASVLNTTLDPGAEDANKDTEEPYEPNVSQPLETRSIVLRLSYSLTGGSPWRILSDGRWRIFHHPEFPATGPSGIAVERIQGLPGKTEAVFHVVINELDKSVKKTQAIILSPTREAAQTTYSLVSTATAASDITTHLSVGGTDVHKDRQRLKEQPHVVVGTIGRLCAMLERKTINPSDIKFLCVESIQHLLGYKYENEFAGFCEQLSKDTVVVFLSTKIRYKTYHDFSLLFTHEPLHFLVEEDPAPEPGAIPHHPEPIEVAKIQDQDTTWVTDADSARLYWFRCEVGECNCKFPTKDDLRSHLRFCHRQTTSNTASAGDGVPYSDKGFSRTEGVTYLCGLCERYPPFKNSRVFGRHLKRMHFEPNNVAVSKVGLAIHSASDGPYMDTYLIHQTEETIGSSDSEESNDSDDTKKNEVKSGRFYCQEHDCGRGFSSKEYLESHMRYFHSRRIVGEQEASLSKYERLAEPHPLETYGLSTSTIAPTHVEERVGNRGLSITARNNAADTLPLHCRICDAPQTLTTKPAVTTCGHLFCFGCITQHVSSTSRCPACSGPLLLHCLFELDLPVAS